MAQVSGSLITRIYSDYRGVDFTDNEVSINRSPDSLNMFKDYSKLGKCLTTRPEVELVATYDNTIFGLFWYTVGNTEMQIVHSGTKLYKVVGDTKEELFTGMMPSRSNAFVYNQILYIKDGINYLKYDGETIGQVVGYIPTTSIARKPAGGGSIYQDVNMLSAWRKNTFLGDGESTEYYLDAKEIDGEAPVVLVNGNTLTPLTDYDYDTTSGKVTFKVAPPKPLTDGQDNVTITFKKTVIGYADRINKCTLLSVFDNRVFFSGNQDYPNTVWHSSLNDPSYCSDLDFYNEGLDLSPVRSMVAGNNALWVFKEPSQANTTVFYHNPVIDADYGKIYPSTHSSIATGCIGAGINFNDDIAFFSDRGMEAINGDVTTEQVIAHRSSMVDSRLLREVNYKDMLLEEWQGYLLVIIDNKVYLADSRAMYQNENHMEYEWFYWELDKTITCTKVKDGVLYLGTADGIYKFGSVNDDEYTEVTFDSTGSLYGVSTQNGTPTPDAPVEIVNKYKAGKYKATINGREYRFTLDDDLRSVGTARDRVYLDNDKLYLEKKAEKNILNGSEDWFKNSGWETNGISCFYYIFANRESQSYALSDKFVAKSLSESMVDGVISEECLRYDSQAIYFFIKTERLATDDVSGFKTWLSNNNVFVQYTLATPTTTKLNYTVSPISYWTTPLDKFNYPQYMKTSNKKGCVTEAEGELIKVYAKTNKTDWELIDSYSNVEDAFVSRIKRKKFKDMQLKFYSTKPFSLYSTTLECYIGGYLKRI